MKKTLKIISVISLILFSILFIGSRISDNEIFNNVDWRNLTVIIYLITSLYYFKMDNKDKKAEIQSLKLELKKIKNSDRLEK